MAQVLTSFLVGLGFDYDRKGAKEIDAGIQSIKASALQLGAVVGGAFGMKALTSDFAASTNTLTDFAQVFGSSAEEIMAFGNALRTEGGTLESFMSQMRHLEGLRSGTLVGATGFIAEAGKAGLNTASFLIAKTTTEAYRNLADQFSRLSQQQRINVAAALGLDEASIRLLSQGSAQVDALVAKFRDIRPLTGEMSQAARDFRNEWVELESNIGGVSNAISEKILPVINDITRDVNSWFGDDRISKVTAIAEGFAAIFQIGDKTPEERSAATGMPKWFFTTDLNETGRALGAPDWMTSPIGDLPDILKGNFRDDINIYDMPPIRIEPVVPTSSFQPAPFAPGVAPSQQPIRITNEVILDGRVIDRRVQDVVGEMGTTTIDELSTNTRG